MPFMLLFCDKQLLQEPIYRIVHPAEFRQLLAGELRLAPCTDWFDFWEAPFRVACADWGQLQVFPGNYMRPVFATCWSKLDDSDTLWRAYSWVWLEAGQNKHPESEGIRLKTTPQQLMAAIGSGLGASESNYARFLTKINYRSETELLSEIVAWFQRHREQLKSFDSAKALMSDLRESAEFYCWKRSAFEHENEIRALVVDARGEAASIEPPPIHIDPNALISEVTFDPRLAGALEAERQQDARERGYRGPFGKSAIGGRRIFQIIMNERAATDHDRDDEIP